MKRFIPPLLMNHLSKLTVFLLLCFPLYAMAQIETGHWATKTKGQAGQLPVFFPTPTASSGNPELMVVPLLGPQQHLLPGGKLQVWVGRNDGSSLPNVNVTIRVPSQGNELVSAGNRATEVTSQTNADGIAEVQLTSPDIPPNSSNGTGGGSGGGGPAAG